MHRTQRAGIKSSIVKGGAAGFFHLRKRAIDPDSQRGGPGYARAEQGAGRIFDSRAATGPATIDANKEWAGLRRFHSATRSMSAPHCTNL
jgi:hypothetical protein